MSAQHTFPDGVIAPAYRHRNPDGSLGGWVALHAAVSPKAFVGRRASVSAGEVCGRARIISGSVSGGLVRGGTIRRGDISGGAMFDGAILGGCMTGGTLDGGTLFGELHGGAIHGGKVRGAVYGGTIFGGTISADVYAGTFYPGAEIRSARDYRVIGPIGSRCDFLAAYRATCRSFVFATGCWHGSAEDLRDRLEEGPTDWGGLPGRGVARHRKDYLRALDYLQAWAESR